MSLIRALSKELQARSDDSLRALFCARPDLISPGVPDFAALAARASGRVSVQRALERLNRPQMQVLETLHLCTNTDTGHSASAAMLKKLINGASVPPSTGCCIPCRNWRSSTAPTRRTALLPAAGKQRHYLPVGSLKDVIGIYPAGLGRSYTELVRLQPAFAQRVVQLVGELHRSGASIPAATTPMEAALALQHWTATPEALAADPGHRAGTDRRTAGQVRQLGHGRRSPGAAPRLRAPRKLRRRPGGLAAGAGAAGAAGRRPR